MKIEEETNKVQPAMASKADKNEDKGEDRGELLALTEKMLEGENLRKLSNLKVDLSSGRGTDDQFDAVFVLKQLRKALEE